MLKYETKQRKIHELVYTRINGNNIKTYPVYVAMLKAVTKDDIKDYCITWDYKLYEGLHGAKIEMIEQIKNHMVSN